MPEQVRQPGGPDPKPERRTVDRAAGRAKLRAERQCRACSSTKDWPPIAMHHLVPRSAGGDDVDANLVPLCDACHGQLHRGSGTIARRRLRAGLAPAELRYVLAKKGAAWLDSRYPAPVR